MLRYSGVRYILYLWTAIGSLLAHAAVTPTTDHAPLPCSPDHALIDSSPLLPFTTTPKVTIAGTYDLAPSHGDNHLCSHNLSCGQISYRLCWTAPTCPAPQADKTRSLGYTDGNGLYNGYFAMGLAIDPTGRVILQMTPWRSPKIGKCGLVKAIWRFAIAGTVSKLGGYIVQEVTFTWAVKSCQGKPVSVTAGGLSSPVHYWEAWRVQPDGSIPGGGSDTFAWNGNHTCSTGTLSIVASAVYHDGVRALPATMVKRNRNTYAGRLPSSTTNPNLGGTKSAAISHVLKTKWDCCPARSDQRNTKIVEKTP
ncbi:hypothetical protein BVY04_04635 [bacterium M21]|nr:hypothetical protein BVY04_04635 [bacterium M21]